MPLQGSLSIERMCHLAQVSRAGFYRYLRGGWPAEEEVTLRSAVQEIVLEHRWRYGYRRVTAELRAQGMVANHKRIARIMREDNLLAVRHEWSQSCGHSPRATRIYLNLAKRMTLLGLFSAGFFGQGIECIHAAAPSARICWRAWAGVR